MIFKKLAMVFFLSALAALLGAAAMADETSSTETLSVQIKPVVELDGKSSEITLGDLLVQQIHVPEVLRRINEVRLADMPNPGESRIFTGDALETLFRPIIRDLAQTAGQKITVRIPARVMVTRKSFKLTTVEIENEITRQLKALCADCQFEFSALSLPALPPSVPSGSSWELHLKHDLPRGSFSVPLEVQNDDGSKRTYWVSGTLAISRKVPVTARAISTGEKIQVEDYLMQLKDVTFANDMPAALTDLQTSVAARELGAGQIIWRNELRRELAVKNGDVVKVVAGSAEWQISIDGVAQGSGYVGDMINVKIQRTAKLVSGILKERGLVEVRE